MDEVPLGLDVLSNSKVFRPFLKQDLSPSRLLAFFPWPGPTPPCQAWQGSPSTGIGSPAVCQCVQKRVAENRAQKTDLAYFLKGFSCLY